MCVHLNATGKAETTPAYAVSTYVNGHWTKPVVFCPGDAVPAVAVDVIREQAQRLLPKVGIGSAWSTTALVNAETVLWAQTGSNRPLASVTVAGQQVRLRIGFAHARWDFGDGHTEITDAPGKPYDRTGDPCASVQCADYYGHTYAETGDMTISLVVSWHAQYSLDGRTWQDITPDIDGPRTTHAIAVRQARGELIPDPGH